MAPFTAAPAHTTCAARSVHTRSVHTRSVVLVTPAQPSFQLRCCTVSQARTIRPRVGKTTLILALANFLRQRVARTLGNLDALQIIFNLPRKDKDGKQGTVFPDACVVQPDQGEPWEAGPP
jgi:hypothetical protein